MRAQVGMVETATMPAKRPSCRWWTASPGVSSLGADSPRWADKDDTTRPDPQQHGGRDVARSVPASAQMRGSVIRPGRPGAIARSRARRPRWCGIRAPVKLACHVAAAWRRCRWRQPAQPACTGPLVAGLRQQRGPRSQRQAAATPPHAVRHCLKPPWISSSGQLDDAIHAGSLSLISLRACKPIGAQGPHLPLR